MCLLVKRPLGSLALLAATLVLLECALSLLCVESKTVRLLLTNVPPSIPDPVLGVRLNPEYPDHDSAGFRNSSVPDSSYVVALGDSQTYGLWVRADEAWPHQLSTLSGHSVYNMGVSGYGPVQHLALMHQAISLHPRWVIEALYAGNDLYDAFYMTYRWSQSTDLRSTDPAIISAIDNAETQGRIIGVDEFRTGPGRPFSNPPRGLRTYLAQHSSLWGLLRAVKAVAVNTNYFRSVGSDALWAKVVGEARTTGGKWVPFEQGPVRTILTPDYRLAVVNLEDPRIREGLRVSIELMKRMSAIAQRDGAHVTIVLIPTKELVFLDTFGVVSPDALTPLAKLGRNEQEMWREIKNELHKSGLSYVDVLPALRDALRAGESPYQITSDGHPNARGHKAIAEAVWRHLQGLENGHEKSIAEAP
jgi:lysophospholipase L1-like esterase